ncbi:MAG: ATP-binding protein [Alphaproteobacteria bacterium]
MASELPALDDRHPIPAPAEPRPEAPRRGALRLAAAALAVAAATAVVVWVVAGWAWDRARGEARAGAEASLDLFVANLAGELGKFAALPDLLASRPDVIDLFDAQGNAARSDLGDSLAAAAQRATGADVVYFMRLDGLTFAASNARAADSFVGQNFSYRPYFRSALDTGAGRYFALGTTSGRRGYYFAHRVARGTRVLGVVVVKVDLEAVEERWRALDLDVMVTDPFGVVFLSNRPDWRLRTIAPMTDAAYAQIAADRRYDGATLAPLAVARESEAAGSHGTVDRWVVPAAVDTGDGRTEYLHVSRPMPEAGWAVHVLVDLAPARRDATLAAVLALALCGLVAAGALLALQRRRQLLERVALNQAAADRLERQVAARTADLTGANRRLGQQIEERMQAEAELRRMQAELVQAGKLAALGQMSAALSHEFNQPLAAIRSYADNAALLLERGRAEDARANVGHIAELTGRMAEISRTLSTFARRPDDRRAAVDLCALVDRVVAFLDGRRQRVDAAVAVRKSAPAVWVLAGEVRLEQVIRNLLTNALDAVAGRDERRVEIAVDRDEGGEAVLTVADSGTGIADDALPRIFDPFFTTKRTGEGLGLGLSIAFNIVKDFDGRLEAANRPQGGALFTVRLPLATAAARAAE